jgi:hypothetical protein
MSETKCQICKKRKAKKRLSTGIDEGHFFVCGKKKCLSALYDILYAPSQTRQQFIKENSHDLDDWQGRSYEQIRDTNLFIMISLAAFFLIVVLAIAFSL